MNAFLTKNLPQIKNICADHAFSTLYVFGSLVKGSFTKNSDVDLLVNFKPIPFGRYAGNYLDFVEKLEKTTGRSVNLVTEKFVENPFFKKVLDETKILVFDSRTITHTPL